MENRPLDNIEEVLKNHKLTLDDYEHIKRILGREPNLLEIGIFSAMWSEHCSYKSSRKYLSGFPTEAEWVIQGPGENAGVIDIGDGMAAVFKMESHNHPSYIEPYQGAATGVGGILRDVFTMGARPVASLDSLRFGDITRDDEVGKYQRHLVKGVVAGISGYGNSMGVPTIGGETSFDSCYNGNILVNAFNLGIAKADEIFYGRAEGVGNPVIYVGSKTGRDGLGGAVMSSDSFNEESKSLRPTVQVGDPFTEKLLLEACLEAFQTDYIIGIQDMGAAGLTSSSFEMADRAGSGMRLDLSKVPAREENMQPYEFMLSESQERMLICAKKGTEDKLIEIFHKWELDAVVIGEVTDSGRMEIFWQGEKVADIPVAPISSECPLADRPIQRPKYLETISKLPEGFGTTPNQEAFIKLFSSVEVVDKSWIYEQYDSMVQTNTIKRGGQLDASVIRVKENGKALAISTDCNPRYCYIDPKGGSSAAVMESGRNVAMSGAVPKAITDCLNFGNPENPEVMWQFAESTYGIKEACKELSTPVVSGNVSLYNETDGVSIFPTPSIAMVGVNEDQNRVLPSVWQKKGNPVYLIGKETKSEFGGSLYLKVLYDEVAGTLPEIDYRKELELWNVVIEGNRKGYLASAKDVNVGGLAIALAKVSAISGFGFSTKPDMGLNIFSETFSRAIVEVKQEREKEFLEFVKSFDISVTKLGEVGNSDKFEIDDISVEMDKLQDIYFNTFEKIIHKED
ncbi:MAG TPA: phosphoribosylformylglycinamidine synthase subunit PurL [Campylobacterales bacterium]|nr:phosphoribosylformylglycinamidine synthase subunit PurL [Campylobacterales bacterium]HIO71327.1 phosphoribosylformylglycinamidine synthase subunit PurL [Campylobacterales bacterium]